MLICWCYVTVMHPSIKNIWIDKIVVYKINKKMCRFNREYYHELFIIRDSSCGMSKMKHQKEHLSLKRYKCICINNGFGLKTINILMLFFSFKIWTNQTSLNTLKFFFSSSHGKTVRTHNIRKSIKIKWNEFELKIIIESFAVFFSIFFCYCVFASTHPIHIDCIVLFLLFLF